MLLSDAVHEFLTTGARDKYGRCHNCFAKLNETHTDDCPVQLLWNALRHDRSLELDPGDAELLDAALGQCSAATAEAMRKDRLERSRALSLLRHFDRLRDRLAELLEPPPPKQAPRVEIVKTDLV